MRLRGYATEWSSLSGALAGFALAVSILATAGPAGGEEGDAASSANPPASAALPSAVARKCHALKEKANALYRLKKYEEAGEVYGEIAALDSLDASARNNLGLCYLKRGMKDSALEANRQALTLADRSLATRDTNVWSFPDLRARKTAYFNLDKLGGPMPEPRAGQCETWSSFTSCRGRLHVCAEQGKRPIEGGTLHWDILRVGLNRSRALFAYEEVEVPALVPRPEMRDMEQAAIDGMPEGRSRWLNRDSSVTIPLGEMLETADPSCTGNCGNLEKVQSECRVIHFDPCAGVVGLACTVQEEGGGDRIVIGEYYLIPAK
jgi:hypothetical protein